MGEPTVPVTRELGDWLGIRRNMPAGSRFDWLSDQLLLLIDDESDDEEPLTLNVPKRFPSLIPKES